MVIAALVKLYLDGVDVKNVKLKNSNNCIDGYHLSALSRNLSIIIMRLETPRWYASNQIQFYK